MTLVIKRLIFFISPFFTYKDNLGNKTVPIEAINPTVTLSSFTAFV